MERLEDAQGHLDALVGELADIDQRTQDQTAARDVRPVTSPSGATMHRRSGATRRGRSRPICLRCTIASVAQLGGVGVGALLQKRCGGCRLDVGAADLARIAQAPSDEVLRCEECNRILVRTAESGI